MTSLRVQITLATSDAIPANYVTNSWCINTGSVPSNAQFAEYVQDFRQFYVDIASVLAIPITSIGHVAKFIDLESLLRPNYPLYEEVWSLPSVSSNAQLPSEVAICLSMQGTRASGTPQARRRGRVYIGTIASATMTLGRPNSTTRTTLVNAVDTLKESLLVAALPAQLCIWSEVDATAVLVNNVWVDDAYDTQRRRGAQVTARTTLVL